MQRLGCDMPDKPSATTDQYELAQAAQAVAGGEIDQFSLDIRQAHLAIVAAIEREKGISPTTADLRKEVKRLRAELKALEAQKERQP